MLAEVVEENLRFVGEHGGRRVVAHGCNWLAAGGTHRHDGAFNVFACETEDAQFAGEVVHAVFHLSSALQVVQFDAVFGKPAAIGVGIGELFLDFSVIVDAPFLRVNEQDFSRLQSSLFFDVRSIEVNDACFRRHDHGVVFGDEIASGSETVSVKHAAGKTSVAEEQGSRTVPGFHEDGVVFVERLEFFADGVLVVETFGHEHRHGVGQTHAAHDHELQHVVQRSGVAHARLHDGAERSNVSERFGGEHRLASLHPGAVAADGVDFAVVSQEAERLSQSPGRERVGGEAGVNHCQSAGEVGLRQVREVFSQLH